MGQPSITTGHSAEGTGAGGSARCRGGGARHSRRRPTLVSAGTRPGNLLVLHPERVPASALTPLLELAGKPGFVVADMVDVDDFMPVEPVLLPRLAGVRGRPGRRDAELEPR
ncbi:DUF5701 family protein [Blastococcus sp. SYSU DS0539]